MSSEVLKARSRLATKSRASVRATEAEIAEAKRDLAAAKIADYVQKVVASAPPLSDEQLTRLAGLLRVGAAE